MMRAAAPIAFAALAVAGNAGPKYMLLDARNVHTADATLVLGRVEKHGALIKEERDYEMRFDNMQPSVWYDARLSKWRAWYSSFTNCSKPKTEIAMCNNAPQQCGSVSPTTSYSQAGRGEGFLYAESDDGITWVKPDLGLTDWKGSKGNNLIELDGMTTQVFLDEAAPASERYKIVTGSNGAGGIAVSADGITWKGVKDLQRETHARWDTPKNLVWDADRRQWIIYLRSAPTVQEPEAGSLRVQSYVHSLTEDFMGNWSTAIPTGLNSSTQYQPDGIVVFPYEGIYIGIGNVFNPSQEPGPAAPIGQVNMVLAWSADGRHWNWVQPLQSFIPLGDAGDFDTCGVFGAKQDPLRTVANDSTMRLYYTGCNGPFFGSRGCALGLATLQRDGFAGYQNGKVITVPVAVAGDSLTISLDGGNTTGVRVGIVGDPERPAEASDPIKGKHTDVIVTWKGKGSDLRKLYGAVQIEMLIPDDAVVFAFSFLASPPPVPTGVRIGAAALKGAQPGQTKYGGGDYRTAWDGDTQTFYDYVDANGGYTEAELDREASISCLRYFPRSQYINGRYVGGTFVGYTSAGEEVSLATIADVPSIRWNLLNVTATTKVTSIRYNSPDGGFGNIAEIEIYGRK